MDDIMTSIRLVSRRIIRPIFHVLEVLERVILSLVAPIDKNLMILESEGDFTDNIRAFYDYLVRIRAYEKWKIVWIVHDPSLYTVPPGSRNIVFISRYRLWSPRFIAYVATARYFIFSHPYWLRRWRKGQTVIYTTHSVAQLKDTPIKAPVKRRTYDHVLTCSEESGKIKSIALKETDQSRFLCLGMPRLDLMYHHVPCRSRLVPGRDLQRLILSMETFKRTSSWDDGGTSDLYAINVVSSEQDLRRLDDLLGTHHSFMIVKIHHLQDMRYIQQVSLRNIRYLTDDDLFQADIQVEQLLEDADVLLTDYSSVFYDYLLVDRPIGFMIGDMDRYTRGFLFDDPLSEMPGEKIRDLNGLFRFIEDCERGVDPHKEERERVRTRSFRYLDDDNCKRLFDWITEHR